MGVGLGVGDGVGLATGIGGSLRDGEGLGEGVGLGAADGMAYETSFEGLLSRTVVSYAVTAKKYVVPVTKFDTNTFVTFPTSMVWV